MSTTTQKKPSRYGKVKPGHSVQRLVLPDELKMTIRREATELGVRPSVVVINRMTESYRGRPFKSNGIASVG